VGAGDNPPYLQPNVIQNAIAQAQERSNGKLLVSSSWGGKSLPTDACAKQANFVLVHCNSLAASDIAPYLASVRALPSFKATPKPIVFNECSTDLDVFKAAVSSGAGWGYYDQGSSDYMDGYQSPPTSWRDDGTQSKVQFFDLVKTLTSSA